MVPLDWDKKFSWEFSGMGKTYFDWPHLIDDSYILRNDDCWGYFFESQFEMWYF